jgi:hypothetical protein
MPRSVPLSQRGQNADAAKNAAGGGFEIVLWHNNALSSRTSDASASRRSGDPSGRQVDASGLVILAQSVLRDGSRLSVPLRYTTARMTLGIE